MRQGCFSSFIIISQLRRQWYKFSQVSCFFTINSWNASDGFSLILIIGQTKTYKSCIIGLVPSGNYYNTRHCGKLDSNKRILLVNCLLYLHNYTNPQSRILFTIVFSLCHTVLRVRWLFLYNRPIPACLSVLPATLIRIKCFFFLISK